MIRPFDPAPDATFKTPLNFDFPLFPFQPTDPLQLSIALKNKGNKYFKGGRYSQAVKCYTEAIEGCPKESAADLATFHQNRAAAHEQLGDLASVVEDCTAALEMNPKYVKALDRRAKAGRKQVRRSGHPTKLNQSIHGTYVLCRCRHVICRHHCSLVRQLVSCFSFMTPLFVTPACIPP